MPCAFNGVPSRWTQGDSVSFSYADPNFPQGAWTIALALLQNGTAYGPYPSTLDADGVSFDFALSPAQSASLPPGRYVARLVATSTDKTQRTSLCQSQVFIAPDLTVGLVPTEAMTILAGLKSGFTGLTGGTISSFSGGGQSWTKKNLKELQEAIDRWQVIVDAERAELGLPNGGGGAKYLVTCF